ncbi:hypothetical protein V1514DRAFT_331789 [Lipomyces japonicus]|uniref:uncharacterized protein n=1 Tax=Lipomyces japonicus TaxID=56871 RepID=UPI0034CDAC52
MIFVLCLAHFCEQHGPRSLICTQVVDKAANTTEVTQDSIYEDGAQKSGTSTTADWCTSCQLELPSGATTVRSSTPASSSGADTESVTTFVSRQDPAPAWFVNAAIAQAFATDSSSLTTGSSTSANAGRSRQGAFMFANRQVGCVIARKFKLADTTARGHARTYAVLAISNEANVVERDADNGGSDAMVPDAWHVLVPAVDDVVNWIMSEAERAVAVNVEYGVGDGGNDAMISSILSANNEPGNSPNWYLRRQLDEPVPRNLTSLSGKNVWHGLRASF